MHSDTIVAAQWKVTTASPQMAGLGQALAAGKAPTIRFKAPPRPAEGGGVTTGSTTHPSVTERTGPALSHLGQSHRWTEGLEARGQTGAS